MMLRLLFAMFATLSAGDVVLSELTSQSPEDVSLIQLNAASAGPRRHVLDSKAGLAPLHCCDSTLDDSSPVVLACDASFSDKISAVNFATVLKAPSPGQDLYHCGRDDVSGDCQQDLTGHHIFEACVGKRSCNIDLSNLPKPCGNQQHQIRIRYSCSCDVDGRCLQSSGRLPHVPLSVHETVIVDALKNRVRLIGVNWAGAHIVNAPGGLDRVPIASIAQQIKMLGFNVVRLTWSVESVLRDEVVEDRVVAANPHLIGKRSLEVLDAAVMALQHEGVMVWLDNHMSDTDWCCDRADCNGFWFNSRWSEDDWVEAWRTLAKRYSKVPAFVGAGLKNEPRSTCGGKSWGGQGEFCNATCLDPNVAAKGCVEMTWASGPVKFQWRRAASRAGAAILKEKPSALISVSGLEYSTDLKEAAAHPVSLPQDRVVYEAHDYAWSMYSRTAGQGLDRELEGKPMMENEAKGECDKLGDRCSGVTCSGSNEACTVRGGNVMRSANPEHFTYRKELLHNDPFPRYAEKLTTWWGYLLRDGVAPVFLSEMGWSHSDGGENDYVHKLSTYIQEGGPLATKGGMDWGYWQLGGVQVGGTGRTAGSTESYGLLNRCWTGIASETQYKALRELMYRPCSSYPKSPLCHKLNIETK